MGVFEGLPKAHSSGYYFGDGGGGAGGGVKGWADGMLL